MLRGSVRRMVVLGNVQSELILGRYRPRDRTALRVSDRSNVRYLDGVK